jgi:DnaK suppressor protein
MKKNAISKTIREHLATRLDYLQGLLNGSAIRLKADAGNYPDLLDRAATEHERAVELTIRQRDSQEIKAIEAALQRIEKGQFGICIHCGEEIAQKRLLLSPMSRLCTSCKAELEKKQRRQGGWGAAMTAFGER